MEGLLSTGPTPSSFLDKPPAFLKAKHIFKVWKPNQKLILYYGKVKEANLTSVKKANILSFLGTKSCLTEKLRLQTSILFERFWKLYVLASIGYQS